MNQMFQGQQIACTFAEKESRKNNSDLYVVKSNSGGIVYEVCKKEFIRPASKILFRYFRGSAVPLNYEPVIPSFPQAKEIKKPEPIAPKEEAKTESKKDE